jgi:hypothetical protein
MEEETPERRALKHTYDLLWAMAQNGAIPLLYAGVVNSLLAELRAALNAARKLPRGICGVGGASSGVTFTALQPLGLSSRSNCTAWPSCRLRNPTMRMLV